VFKRSTPMRRSLAIFGACTLVALAWVVLRRGGAPATPGPLARDNVPPGRLARDTATTSSDGAPRPASVSPRLLPLDALPAGKPDNSAGPPPVDLEAAGVIERLERSRHDLLEPKNPRVLPGETFRFTLARKPLVELARRHEIVAWPVLDGDAEPVQLGVLREEDGNLFISGDLIDGPGQLVLVMTPDDAMTAQLTSRRGLYSYTSQLDEIVAHRVAGSITID